MQNDTVQFGPCDQISLLYPLLYGVTLLDCLIIEGVQHDSCNHFEGLCNYTCANVCPFQLTVTASLMIVIASHVFLKRATGLYVSNQIFLKAVYREGCWSHFNEVMSVMCEKCRCNAMHSCIHVYMLQH